MVQKNYLFLLSTVIFICINSNSYSLNMEYYNYSHSYDNNEIKFTRSLKTDTTLESKLGNTEKVTETQDALSVINNIPVLSAIINPVAYLAQVGIISNVKDIVTGADISAVADVAMIADTITNILSPSDEESNAAIAVQQTFGTNLYCKHQKFYIEEEEYVSKQKSTSGGGYSMFPVYPMDIPVNETTGQCDVGSVIDTYFEDGQLTPADSKCSYAYSATSDQCILDLDIPILSTYIAQELVVNIVCSVASIRNMSKESVEEADEAAEKAMKEAREAIENEMEEELEEEITEKMIEEIGKKASDKVLKEAKEAELEDIIGLIADSASLVGVDLFFDTRLAFDPIMMYAIMQIEIAINFAISLPQDISDFNWPCVAARPLAILALDVFVKSATAITLLVKHTEAKEAIQNITFCGYDWLSYRKTNDGTYYTRGMFEHSRYKKVSDCINGNTCLLKEENVCDDVNKDGWCSEIEVTSKNIKNKLFREYTYGGKEYEAQETIENSIRSDDNRYEAIGYNPDYCIDPRLPQYKGFMSVGQRYYMRGNEKANFACNRFFYNHNDGCVLPEKDILEEDKEKLKKIVLTNGSELNQTINILMNIYNKVYYIIEKTNTNAEIFNKYVPACKNAFTEARKCCKYRSRHFVCLENKSNNHNKFCFSNVVDKYGDEEQVSLFAYLSNRNTDSSKVTCTIDGYNFEASKKEKTNHICVFSDGFCPYNFKLNAGLNYRASYCDANYFSDYKDHGDALKRTATQYNAADCREGLFSAKMREEYKKIHSNSDGGELLGAYVHHKVRQDMIDSFNYNAEDFTKIYNFSKLAHNSYEENNEDNNEKPIKTHYTADELKNIQLYGFSRVESGTDVGKYVLNSLDVKYAEQIRTSAYGQVKNFCQYRAHCVEVEEEREYPQEYSINSSFLDISCNGSSQHSRNILQTHNGGVPRQLSVPIVECVYESLKNLVNGVAGMSTCINSSSLNVDGYCDDDTKESVEDNLNKNNLSFFEDRYYRIGENYMIKGTVLPDDYNPFIKLQKYFINIIKTILCLFLVLYSYNKLILGELDILNRQNIMNLTRQIVKFSIVAYLVFSSGWRSGIYNYIVNFSVSAYDFVNRLFVKVVQNPKNQILNFDNPNGTVIKVVKQDGVTGEYSDVTMCYRYNLYGNIDFAVKDGVRVCERGFKSKQTSEILISNNENFPKQKNNCRLIFSNNQEISRLLYFIDTYNKTSGQKLKIKVSTSGDIITTDSSNCIQRTSWNDVDAINNGLWNKDYDGCYFDTTEYKNDKQYISFFDTLDCKMIKYLGYSTNSLVPNMLIYSAIMLLPQYFFPNFGLLTSVVTTVGTIIFGFMLTFLFLMFNVIIKAVYVFASSFFILSILIFLSPIILPMMLFEKTKQYYDSWFEQVLGTVLKPSIGFALLILYVNLMDIMLIGDEVIFNNHSNIGRGASISCPNDAVSFFCLVNKNPAEAYEILEIIFNGGLVSLLISIIIAFLFFKLSDSFLDELNNIIEKIFTGIGSTSSITGRNAIDSSNTEGTLHKAKSYGKKIEEFRETYIRGTMESVINKGLHGSYKNSIFSKFGDSVIDARTRFNEKKLSHNEKQLNNLNNLQQEEQELGQRKIELLQKNTETGVKLSKEEIEELVSINSKLEKNKSKQEKLDREDIEKSIAKEKDRLGIGDGTSGAHKIGERYKKFTTFTDKYLHLEKISNKIAKGGFIAKSKVKDVSSKVVGSTKDKINKIRDKRDNKYGYFYSEDERNITYTKHNIKNLEKINKKLLEVINKNDVNKIEEQIQRNKDKIEELSRNKEYQGVSGENGDSSIIQTQIKELEEKNKQLEEEIKKTTIGKLEEQIRINTEQIDKLTKEKEFIEKVNGLDKDTQIIKLQEEIDKFEQQNNENIQKINKHKDFINTKKIEFMNNYYTITKQKQEVDDYYADDKKKD